MRTLRNWELAAVRPAVRQGRPPHARAAWWRVHRLVRRELQRQGWTSGWREVRTALAGRATRYQVQRSVAAWKAKHRRAVRRHRAAYRVQVDVRAAQAVWAQDATHVGRVGGRALAAEVVMDRATHGLVTLRVGPAATATDVLAQLEAATRVQGAPLVWQTDNGRAYRDRRVQGWLERERVIALVSRPHVPQDNGAMERRIGGLKAEAGLGRGARPASAAEAAVRLVRAQERLQARPRATASRTAAGARSATVNRVAFFTAAHAAIQRAGAEQLGGRARRTAEREAIWRTLEQFGYVVRTRGGVPIPSVKPEGLS